MNLIEYWPRFLQELVEFGEISQAEQPEFDQVNIAVEDMALEFSAFTLTAAGIKRWEKILGITGMEADNLDSRRFRIQSRLMEQIPITKRTLYAQLQTLCGEGGFTMSINYGDHTVGIVLALTSKSAFADVELLAHKSVPANMIVTVSLMYNKHGAFKSMTHAQLHAFTHSQLRNEVFP